MQGTGHLEGRSTACAGPFFIDGANGGFIVTGDTSPGPGEWTAIASGDCRFETSTTVVDITDTNLSQFVSVSANSSLFPGCFRLCLTTKNKKIDCNGGAANLFKCRVASRQMTYSARFETSPFPSG